VGIKRKNFSGGAEHNRPASERGLLMKTGKGGISRAAGRLTVKRISS
jgi:hypothetical protein